MKYTRNQIELSKQFLLDILTPDSTVYMLTIKTSRSGMSRIIKVMAVYNEFDDIEVYSEYAPDGVYYIPELKSSRINDISYHVARVCGYPFVDKHPEGVRINGCGMDVHLALVDILSLKLFNRHAKGYPDGNGLTKITL